MSECRGKRNKRKRKDNDERSDSEEDEYERVQRERSEKCIVIIRFNEKVQESMKEVPSGK